MVNWCIIIVPTKCGIIKLRQYKTDIYIYMPLRVLLISTSIAHDLYTQEFNDILKIVYWDELALVALQKANVIKIWRVQFWIMCSSPSIPFSSPTRAFSRITLPSCTGGEMCIHIVSGIPNITWGRRDKQKCNNYMSSLSSLTLAPTHIPIPADLHTP